MAKCFLLCSQVHSQITESFRRLLEVVGFEVFVFEYPDLTYSPEAAVEDIMKNSQALIVLYGPPLNTEENTGLSEGASWLAYAVAFAYRERKPLALVVHSKARVPEFFDDLQAYPRFDFSDATSFLENVHLIIKYLLDLKRQVDLPWGLQPYVFTKAIQRNRISRSGATTIIDVYSEVIARQVCDMFEHAIDTGGDKTSKAGLGSLAADSYEIEAIISGNFHQVSILVREIDEYEFSYFIKVEPPLQPGETIGYRRSFEVPNRFPLSHTELLNRLQKEGYPSVLPRNYYGDFFEVLYDIETVTIAIHFPRRVKLDAYRALVVHSRTNLENKSETDRAQQYLQLREDPGDSERILELTIPRPSINHLYYLLYKPGD